MCSPGQYRLVIFVDVVVVVGDGNANPMAR
jgi:hypothetical protein